MAGRSSALGLRPTIKTHSTWPVRNQKQHRSHERDVLHELNHLQLLLLPPEIPEVVKEVRSKNKKD